MARPRTPTAVLELRGAFKNPSHSRLKSEDTNLPVTSSSARTTADLTEARQANVARIETSRLLASLAPTNSLSR